MAFNAAYLERLLLNLLSNAFKFTPEGGTVTVSVKVTSGAVELTVLDTGAGIPQALLPTLFDRYLHTDRLDPRLTGWGWDCLSAVGSPPATAEASWSPPLRGSGPGW